MNDELRAAFARLDRALQDARAACAAAGVPCTMRFDRLTAITARLTFDNKPGLFVTGTVGATDGATFTTTPIADIRKQAAEAGIELPEVTVRAGYEWSHIAEVQHRADGTTIFGQVAGEGIHNETNLTPAQVLALCALAGWPRPEVMMVCTYCDGTPCEVNPGDITNVEKVERDALRETKIELNPWVGESPRRCVREPVAVVQRMIDACKEGE